MASKLSNACFLYFAGCQGFVKIGITRDVYSRVNVLSTASPWPVTLLAHMEAGLVEERVIHNRFRHEGLHHRNEWFRNEGAVAELVKLIAGYPPREARAVADQWWFDRFPGKAQIIGQRWDVYAKALAALDAPPT